MNERGQLERVFTMADSSVQAMEVVSAWTDQDFPRDAISLLAGYEAAKDLGDAITRVADPEIGEELGDFLARLEDPAVLEVKGRGPVVAAGPVSGSRAWKNRTLADPISEALREVGVPPNRLSAVVEALENGKIFLGVSSSNGNRFRDAVGVLTARNLPPITSRTSSAAKRTSPESQPDPDRAYSDVSSRRVSELMEQEVASVSVEAELESAMQRLREKETGFLAVLSDGIMVGILTPPSIPVRASGTSPSSRPLRVSDVMSDQFVHCLDTQTAGEAAAIMDRFCVSRLPVLDRDGRPRGIINSITSLLVSDEDELLTD